jgi:hypothetical protein
MAYYLMAPDGKPTTIAPSLCNTQLNGMINDTHHTTHGGMTNGTEKSVTTNHTKGVGTTEPGNPTVLPLDVLKQYHFAFLIRHPRRGIPSFYRCTIPPLDDVTGFKHFMKNEAGYLELRVLFDYLKTQGLIGPRMAEGAEAPTNGQLNGSVDHTNGHANGHTNGYVNGHTNGTSSGHASDQKEAQVSITVIDADDLLDHPQEVVQAFCKETGVPFTPDMLNWDNPEDQQYVEEAFSKWIGFHNDAIQSKNLSPRTHAHVSSAALDLPRLSFVSWQQQKTITEEGEDQEWREKYGEEGQKIIRECVNENVAHYEYLKQFAIRVWGFGVQCIP